MLTFPFLFLWLCSCNHATFRRNVLGAVCLLQPLFSFCFLFYRVFRSCLYLPLPVPPPEQSLSSPSVLLCDLSSHSLVRGAWSTAESQTVGLSVPVRKLSHRAYACEVCRLQTSQALCFPHCVPPNPSFCHALSVVFVSCSCCPLLFVIAPCRGPV